MNERENFDNIFQSSEDNNFDEFEKSPAEQYFISETKETANEDIKVEEFLDLNKKEVKKEHKSNSFHQNKPDKPKLHLPSGSTIATSSAVVIVSASIIGIVPLEKTSFGTVVKESISYKNSISEVAIQGEIQSPNSQYAYYAAFTQYKENMVLNEKKEELKINEDFSFSISFPLSYGLDKYLYQILCEDSENTYSLYSETIAYTIRQDYQASYTKTTPIESKFDFLENGNYKINLETNFSTDYPDAFAYQLDILDKSGNTLGTYKGIEKQISVEISPSDEIYFRYKDIGKFNEDIIEYNEYLLSDKSIVSLPNVQLPDEYDFTGEYFALVIQAQSICEEAILHLILDNGKETHEKEIYLSDEKTILELNDFDSEIGTLNVSGYITFKDQRIDSYEHQIPIQSKSYDMSYKFEIKEIEADCFQSGQDTIPIHYTFDCQIPSSYQIQFESDDGTIYSTIPVTDQYTLSALPSGDGGQVKVCLLNENKTKIKELETTTILSESKLAELTDGIEKSYSAVNPNDSLITYNSDSTINIYRDMQFTCENENIYYDSFVYTDSEIDEDTGQTSYIGGIHHRSRNRISAMENLPLNQYLFLYYLVYQYQGVCYFYQLDQPSGSIFIPIEEEIKANATYDSKTDTTNILIKNDNACTFENKVKYKNKEYQYDNFLSSKESTYTLTLSGNALNNSLEVYATKYDQNYDTISSLTNIKGERYTSYQITIQE